jgi:hypothetical protein
MLREELHAEVLDCNGGLVRGAGLSEPEPDVALGLVRDLQGTLPALLQLPSASWYIPVYRTPFRVPVRVTT